MLIKHKPDDLIHQPFWDKHNHDATFYCPNCNAPYYDHTEWDGDDRWYFDCVVCGKTLYVIRKETINYTYDVDLEKGRNEALAQMKANLEKMEGV